MSPQRRHWRDGLRWAACFVIVLGVHAAAAATLLARWQPADEPIAGGPPKRFGVATSGVQVASRFAAEITREPSGPTPRASSV